MTQDSLKACQSIGKELNVATPDFDPDYALSQAKRLDHEFSKGIVRGKLHGIPLANKDVFSKPHHMPMCDCAVPPRPELKGKKATVLNRLEMNGAVDLGPFHTSELTVGMNGNNNHYGQVLNPLSYDHIPGGSSSGTASAIAADITFGGLGTDTLGSIRSPAAFCGLAGHRPTIGSVPSYGVIDLAPTVDMTGPLARTVEDCALIYEAITEKEGYFDNAVKKYQSHNIAFANIDKHITDNAVLSTLHDAYKII